MPDFFHRLFSAGRFRPRAPRPAEERVAREREFHLALLDKFPVPVWRSDAQGECDYFNQTWLEFTGRSMAQERGQGWTEGVHPADLARCLQTYRESFALRRSFEMEYRLRRHDGEYRWLLDHGRPFHDLDGQFAGYLGSCHDITERKLTEEALRAGEDRLRIVTENARVGLVAVNLDRRYVYANIAYAEILGLPLSAIVGQRVPDVMAGIYEDRIRPRLDRAFAGERVTFEVLWPTTKGSRLYEATYEPLPADGAVGQVVAVITDITERKAAEEALQVREAQFRRFLDSNIIGVLFWNMEGGITEANDLFLQIVQYTREDFRQGKLDWKSLTPPEYAGLDEKALAELAVMGTCTPFEKEYIRKGGSRVSVLLGAALFDVQNGTGIAFVLDITERKHAEESLRMLSHRLLQAEDEERRRIAKELHDSTAQDLVAVMMNLSLLQETLGEGEKGAAAIIADTLAILENSVNDIRTLSYVVHPPRLDESGLAGALTEYAAGFGRRAAIPVRVELPPDLERLPEEIELALFRVVQESLANVLRHSGSDTATIRLTKNEDRVMLEVIDRGHGLPPAVIGQNPGALGVGIVGIRERMEHFGGSLELESSSHGTTVRAVLPLPEKMP